jgi:hypothetical protein
MTVSLRARSFVALVVATTLSAPPATASASPAPLEVDRKALADFEAGFNEGQKKFDAGEYIDAARTWAAAAGHLKESARHKDNRQAVYEYVADAWTKGLEGSEDVGLLREAVTSLDSYCETFTVAYGTETPIHPKIVAAREDMRRRLGSAETVKPATPEGPGDPPPGDEPPRETDPSGPKWKGLAIGGGVALGLGLGLVVMGAVGGARSAKLDKQFDDPANMCDLNNLMGECKSLFDDGKTANQLTIVGGVLGGVFVVTGAVLLAIGLKRRAAARSQALAPALGPGFVGLTLRGSF